MEDRRDVDAGRAIERAAPSRSIRRTAIPPEWRFDTARPLGAAALDNVFNGWTGHAEVSHGDEAFIALDADTACDRLVVYAPPGRDFVCLEPVTHETDAFNRAAAGAVDTGMRVLGPGESFSCTMRLAVVAPRATPISAPAVP